MNINELQRELNAKRGEVERLIMRTLPVKVGRMAKDHYQDNFRKSGFVDGGLHKWKPTKRQSSGSRSASSNYTPLLSRRNHLFASIKYAPGVGKVTVGNGLSYAAVHNFGGTVHPRVTEKLRKYAWAMYYKAMGKSGAKPHGRRKGKKGIRAASMAEPPEARFWKAIALTKKTTLTVKIPQRQFIGESKELGEKINRQIEQELINIINR